MKQFQVGDRVLDNTGDRGTVVEVLTRRVKITWDSFDRLNGDSLIASYSAKDIDIRGVKLVSKLEKALK